MIMTVSWSWPPTFRAVGVVSNWALQMPFLNTYTSAWPWPCRDLNRPHSGRSELSAIGRSKCRFKIPILVHDHDRVVILTARIPGGRSCQQSGRSKYRLEILTYAWPWPCRGLDRSHSGRSELPAIGALQIPFRNSYLCMTMTVSWSWPPPFRAVGVASNRGAPNAV